MMHEDGSYFLFYSASNFQLPSYRMMVARSGDLLGPYTKGEVPVVETDWDRCVAAPIHSGRNQGFLSNWCIGCIYLVKILAHCAMLQCMSRYNKPP